MDKRRVAVEAAMNNLKEVCAENDFSVMAAVQDERFPISDADSIRGGYSAKKTTLAAMLCWMAMSAKPFMKALHATSETLKELNADDYVNSKLN